MLLNLTDYFKAVKSHGTETVTFEAEEIVSEGVRYKIISKPDIPFDIANVGDGQVRFTASGRFIIASECDRCLKPVEVDIDLDMDYLVIEPDGYRDIDNDEQYFMIGYELDCELLIHNELIMSLPMKILCREDCKGLCPKCGRNLNEGDCGCDTFVPDPRMAAIQDIFNAYNKEV